MLTFHFSMINHVEFGSSASEASGRDVNSIHHDELFMKDTLIFGGSVLLSHWMVSVKAELEMNPYLHAVSFLHTASLLHWITGDLRNCNCEIKGCCYVRLEGSDKLPLKLQAITAAGYVYFAFIFLLLFFGQPIHCTLRVQEPPLPTSHHVPSFPSAIGFPLAPSSVCERQALALLTPIPPRANPVCRLPPPQILRYNWLDFRRPVSRRCWKRVHAAKADPQAALSTRAAQMQTEVTERVVDQWPRPGAANTPEHKRLSSVRAQSGFLCHFPCPKEGIGRDTGSSHGATRSSLTSWLR